MADLSTAQRRRIIAKDSFGNTLNSGITAVSDNEAVATIVTGGGTFVAGVGPGTCSVAVSHTGGGAGTLSIEVAADVLDITLGAAEPK